MTKLYPPYIEGSIPAFYGERLTLPYEMNKTVGYEDIVGFKLKIMSVSTNTIIGYINSSKVDQAQNKVTFIMPIEKMKIGQFYKIQLAYLGQYNYRIDNYVTEEKFKINNYYIYKDNKYILSEKFNENEKYYIQEENVGFYSSIGVVKFTAIPSISIKGLNASSINLHSYDYVGEYEPNEKDILEKEITFKFDVYDNEGKLYYTSGKKVHNYLTEDIFELTDTLNKKDVFYLKYTIWTVNGLEFSTPKYRIAERESLDLEFDFSLQAELNPDEAYINLFLIKGKTEKFVTGSFVLIKSSDEDNYKTWNEIYNFKFSNEKITKNLLFKDFIIKQGVKYKYAIRQYNSQGLYTDPKELSNEEGYILADFEDMFLFDGERQLKLRFNGRVNSFKTALLEQKVNTIGSKYPFIFKNGNVAYKEFPINALISYISDNENLFRINEHLDEFHRHSTPNDENKKYFDKATDLTAENYTKERIFKNEVLDWLNNGKPKIFKSSSEGNYIIRLLNTSLSPENGLGRMIHNFSATAYEIADYNYKNMLKYNFIVLADKKRFERKWETVPFYTSEKGFFNGIVNPLKPAITAEFNGMRPGDMIIVDEKEIKIGSTGDLVLDYNTPINEIIIPEGSKYFGQVTFSYNGERLDNFGEIEDIYLEETPLRQIYGDTEGLNSILEYLEDEKTKVQIFYLIRFYLKDINKQDIQANTIKIINNNNEITIDLTTSKSFEVEEPENFDFENNQIYIGANVVCECSYQTKVITYSIENEEEEILVIKEQWQNDVMQYNNALQNYKELASKEYDNLNMLEEKFMIAEIEKNKEEKIKNLLLEEIQEYLKDGENIYNYLVDGKQESNNYNLNSKEDYSPLSLEEAIDYVKNIDKTTFILRQIIEAEIIKNKRFTSDENSFEERLWEVLDEIFKKIKEEYPILLENFCDEIGFQISPNFTMIIPGSEDYDNNLTGNNYPGACYGEDASHLEVEGSLWVSDFDTNYYESYEPKYNAPNEDDNDAGDPSVYIDVASYEGIADPNNLNLSYDIWFYEEDDIVNTKNLNNDLYLFRYKNNNYKDLVYVIKEGANLDILSAINKGRNDYKSLNQNSDFIQERYVIELNRNYFLFNVTNNINLLTDRIAELEKINDNKKTEAEKIEYELLIKYSKDEDSLKKGLYNYFKPVSHQEIFNKAISLYCTTSESLYEKYGKYQTNFDFIPSITLDNLNSYFHYKTVDIYKIKEIFENLRKQDNKIEDWTKIINLYTSENLTEEGSRIYSLTKISKLENDIIEARENMIASYQEYIKILEEKRREQL